MDSGSNDTSTVFRTCHSFWEGSFRILDPPLVVSLFAKSASHALACRPLIGLVASAIVCAFPLIWGMG